MSRNRAVAQVVAAAIGLVATFGCAAEVEPPWELRPLDENDTPTSTPTSVLDPLTSDPQTLARASDSGADAIATGEGADAEGTATWVDATANLVGLPSASCGNLSYVSTRPDRDTLMASVAEQGLFVSTDETGAWTPLGEGPGVGNRTSSVVYDPQNPETFWTSSAYGPGLFKTTDGGVTFSQMGDVNHLDLVSVDFTDPERNTLLGGAHENVGLYLSRDGGDTWDDIALSLPAGSGYTQWPHVLDAQTFLLGTVPSPDATDAGVFRTTDGGATWTQVHEGAVVGRPAVAATDGTISWLLEGGNGLIRSADQGATWTTFSAPVARLSTSLVELPDGRLVTLGGQSLVSSSDGGATWQSLGPYLPYEPAGVVYSTSRKAFFIWRYDCGAEAFPVPEMAVMRLDFSYETQ